MRAAVLRAYNADLAIETLPDPGCEPDGVVLRTLACGVCRSDWHGWTGEHPRVKPGQIPGHEYCGEVVEAGPLADWRRRRPGGGAVHPRLRPLRRAAVAGHQNVCPDQRLPGFVEPGAFAEYVAVPLRAQPLAPCPRRCRRRSPPALGCRVTTAWHALTGRADLHAGEWLAMHGTGGIGLSATLILGRALGARVVVVDVVPEKLDARARPRRRGGGRRARRRHRRGDPRADRRRRATSRSRRSGSRRPPTPRSSACGRSAGTSRSGCRSATPRAWRST